jgi:hypothetical protein
MTWILIIWAIFYQGGGIAMQEFSSKEKCEKAGELVFEQNKYKSFSKGFTSSQKMDYSGNFICVEK